jgi:hypothetical protein
MLPNIAISNTDNYYSALARYARFIPDLMPRVMKMRQEENKQTLKDRIPLPHIRDALQNVPSEDLGTQKVIQDRMRVALDDMHRQIIDDIAKFIDNKISDVGWLASPVNVDYIASDAARDIVTAYDKDQLLSLLRLLTFFAIAIDTSEIPHTLVHKIDKWYADAESMFGDINFPKRAYKILDPKTYRLPNQGKIKTSQQTTLVDGMKQARKILRDDPKVKRGLATSPDLSNRYQKILNNLFTFFNRGSDNAYDFIVNNVHALGDNDLNALMEPKFNGDPRAEAKKLARIVQKHGDNGHQITDETTEHLKENDPEALNDYRRQYNLVRNAARVEIKKLVRSTGKPTVRADQIKTGLEQVGLPTHYIPKGFEKGSFDQDMNQYAPNGERLSVNVPAGSWIKWHPAGVKLKSIGEYQTPFMAKPAGLYTMKHTTGILQEKKYGDVENNLENIDKLKARWVKDSKSSDSKIALLGNMVLTMYYLGVRVGNPSNETAGEQTFGLTTFTVGHVHKRGDELIFSFAGKSGIKHDLKLDPVDGIRWDIVKFIEKKMQGKSRRDPLWTYGNRTASISSSSVNQYLKETGWSGSAKTFRTVRGTSLMEDLLEKAPDRFNSRQNAIDFMIKTLTNVGDKLGHKRTNKDGKLETTWMTAASAYVNPQLIIEFFHKHNVNPMPNWAEKLQRVAE